VFPWQRSCILRKPDQCGGMPFFYPQQFWLYPDSLLCFRLKMLSRLSGLANTVLQELSGDGGDAVTDSESSVTVSTL